MPKIEFVRSGALKIAMLDGKELDFNGNTATKVLKPDEYTVQWFARGNPGDALTLSVGRPDEKPIKKIERSVPESRKDSGAFKFEV